MKKYVWIVILALLVLLAGTGWARAAPAATLDRYVTGGGGTTLEQGALSLDNTIGQPVAGRYGSRLCVGFWCPSSIVYEVFVPLTMRDYP